MSNFEPKQLRQLFGQFPTGVTIITTRSKEGDPIGMTASSFNTVSITPTLILWSIDKTNYSLEIFKHCEYFAVNILTEQQIDLSNKFAGRGQDKFNDIEYTEGMGGSPLLPNVLAQLECKRWNVHEGGDHLILIGEVLNYKMSDSLQPLVFSQGSYAQANPHYKPPKATHTDTAFEQDFLNDHLLYLLRATYNTLSKEFYQRIGTHKGVSPDTWRIYASLATGQPLSIASLSDLVMQPNKALFDSLSAIGSSYVTYNSDNAQLTCEGIKMAEALLQIAEEYKNELSNRVGVDSFTAMKDTLRKLGLIPS